MTSRCAFLSDFLVELNSHLDESLTQAMGEVENALHQKLQSCGDKKKQARQLNIVAKCSDEYMARIRAIFEKNFDKFELYVNRNLANMPDDLDQVMASGAQQEQQEKKKDEDKAADTMDGAASMDEESLKRMKKEEEKEKELDNLREKLLQLQYQKKLYQAEQEAVTRRKDIFQQEILSKLSFLEKTSSQTLSPLKQTVDKVTSLHQSIEHMEELTQKMKQQQEGHPSSVHTKKRLFVSLSSQQTAKAEEEATYREIRQRHLAKMSSMTLTNATEQEQLHHLMTKTA